MTTLLILGAFLVGCAIPTSYRDVINAFRRKAVEEVKDRIS